MFDVLYCTVLCCVVLGWVVRSEMFDVLYCVVLCCVVLCCSERDV
jgi:hypothetical protein